MAGKKGMRWRRPLDSPTTIEECRKEVKTISVIRELMDHVLGKKEMSSSQVAAGLGLLRKTLPDLSTTEVTGKDGEALKTEILVSFENARSRTVPR